MSSTELSPTRNHAANRLPLALALYLLITASALLLSAPADEKRISIYSPVANYSLNLAQRDGRDYIGLLEVLEPLGNVSANSDGKKWKLRFNNIAGVFAPGNSRARIRGRDLDLTGRFFLDDGRGLVPVDSLVSLLPQFLGIPVVFHSTGRRLFIREAGTTYNADLSKTTPPKLVVNFSAPVNPTIATEPGKLHMMFVRDPLVASGQETLNFNDKAIFSATFQETNGAAEINVAGSVPLLASFSNDGRTITIAPAGQGTSTTAQAQPPGQPPAPPAPSVAAQPATPPAPALPQARRFLAMVDAGHGGAERGAAFTAQLLEKDVALAFARHIRQELQNHGISVLMTRDSDTSLTLDQRASLANAARPSLYIGVHAGSDGTGVRVYTGLMPSGADNHGPFLAWENAQGSWLSASQSAAAIIAGELRKRISVRNLAAPLRPLNNVISPALAIEVATREGNLADLTSVDYQQLVASAVASGVAALRDRSGAAQ